mmetsp:Transcript_14542/g.24875  ORF Transcript_14542/g.24875 Transcript_14542/m.24875 type:complete len:98 (+) Transcript_14542:158-451(+)
MVHRSCPTAKKSLPTKAKTTLEIAHVNSEVHYLTCCNYCKKQNAKIIVQEIQEMMTSLGTIKLSTPHSKQLWATPSHRLGIENVEEITLETVGIANN